MKVSPSEGKKFYLRVLLSHVGGLTSWEYLLSPNDRCFPAFKKVVEHWDFWESDIVFPNAWWKHKSTNILCSKEVEIF